MHLILITQKLYGVASTAVASPHFESLRSSEE